MSYTAGIQALIAAFRKFKLNGVPESGDNWPDKIEIQAAFAKLDGDIQAIVGGAKPYETVALLPTGVNLPPNGARATVYNDPDADNNTFWVVINGMWQIDTDLLDSIVNQAGSTLTDLVDAATDAADRAETAEENASAIADAVKLTAPANTVLKVVDDEGYAGLSFTIDGGMDFGAAGIRLDRHEVGTPEGRLVFSDEGFGVRDRNGYYFMWVPSTGLGGDLRPLITRIQALENDTGGGGSASWMHQDVAKTFPFPRAVITTHRGAIHTGAPENSIEAIYAAARAGFTIDETDIQFTSDGVPVIMHDSTLDRTCKVAADYSDITTGVRVDSITAEYLRDTYVLASDNISYRRPVPTLEEACAAYSAVGMKPILEFKKGANTTVEQITTVWDIAARILGEDGFLFGGFFISAAFDYIRKNLTQKTFFWYYFDADDLTADNLGSAIADCLAHQPAGLFINWANPILPDAIEASHAVRLPVAVWTVSPDRFDYVSNLGADCIVTDTLAPTPTVQEVIHKSYSGTAWTDWTTTGTLANGEVALEEGETIISVSLPDSDIDYGAWYISGEFTGALTVTGTNIPSTDLTNDAAAFRSFNVCTRYAGSAVSITLTAGADGAVVHSLNLCILKL